MDRRETFLRVLRHEFVPLLRSEGFKGSGQTYWRLRGELANIVNIQGSWRGGECCINLGVHPVFLPTPSGSPACDPRKLHEYDCEFRTRLTDTGDGDQWWSYGHSESEAEANVADIVKLFERSGEAYFGQFEPFPERFEGLTPEQIDVGEMKPFPASTTRASAALFMIRLMRHLGRIENVREFARVGLKHSLPTATGLQAEFKFVIESTDARIC